MISLLQDRQTTEMDSAISEQRINVEANSLPEQGEPPKETSVQHETVPLDIRVKKYLKDLEERYRRLQRDKTELAKAYERLIKEYNTLGREHQTVRQNMVLTQRRHEDLIGTTETLKQELVRVRGKCAILEKDNEQLRSHIASMSSAQEPLHEEDFYILNFNQIRMDIESWIAKETRAKPNGLFPEASQSAILSALSIWGEQGKIAAEKLKGDLQAFYDDRRTRIVLIRHLVALALYDAILSRFAFGLPRDSSDYFHEIEKQIFTEGLPLHT